MRYRIDRLNSTDRNEPNNPAERKHHAEFNQPTNPLDEQGPGQQQNRHYVPDGSQHAAEYAVVANDYLGNQIAGYGTMTVPRYLIRDLLLFRLPDGMVILF